MSEPNALEFIDTDTLLNEVQDRYQTCAFVGIVRKHTGFVGPSMVHRRCRGDMIECLGLITALKDFAMGVDGSSEEHTELDHGEPDC